MQTVNGYCWQTPPSSVRFAASFSLRAKSRLRRLRSDTRLRAQPLRGSLSVSKNLPLRGRCPEGAEGENLAIARNISGSRTVLSPTACGRSPLAEGAKG